MLLVDSFTKFRNMWKLRKKVNWCGVLHWGRLGGGASGYMETLCFPLNFYVNLNLL